MSTLADEFHRAMISVYEVAKDHDYHASRFKAKVDELGGVGAAKYFLATRQVQTGLMKLWELGLLGHSMEAAVIQEQFHPLFSETEITEARTRLEELGYFRHQP